MLSQHLHPKISFNGAFKLFHLNLGRGAKIDYYTVLIIKEGSRKKEGKKDKTKDIQAMKRIVYYAGPQTLARWHL